MANIGLSHVFDADFWTNGQLPTDIKIANKVATDANNSNIKMSEDAVPNVRVFVDSASDDQITVIVVDVQNDITAW